MVYVVAKCTVKEGQTEAYIALAKKLVAATKENDEGCLLYEVVQDSGNPQVFAMIERWESKEALDLHMNAPHFKEMVPLLGEYRVGASEVQVFFDVKAE